MNSFAPPYNSAALKKIKSMAELILMLTPYRTKTEFVYYIIMLHILLLFVDLYMIHNVYLSLPVKPLIFFLKIKAHDVNFKTLWKTAISEVNNRYLKFIVNVICFKKLSVAFEIKKYINNLHNILSAYCNLKSKFN